MIPQHKCFWFTRPGDLSYGIDVTLNFSGEASPTDYKIFVGASNTPENISNGTLKVTIPTGQTSVNVKVQAFDDKIIEQLYETLVISIASATLQGNPNVAYAYAEYDPKYDDPENEDYDSDYDHGFGVVKFKIEDNDTLTLEKVKFLGDLGMIADPGLPVWDTSQHWLKNQPGKTVPVAYANGGNKVKTDAEFSKPAGGSVDSGLSLEVRFVASFPSGKYYSDWEAVGPDFLTFAEFSASNVTALQTLQTIYCTLQPDFIEQMELEWELRVNGDNNDIRTVSGSSLNPFYVTRGGGAGEYHTVIHTGCVAAKGLANDDTVFNAIWGKFAGLDIKSVEVVNGAVVDNELLSYYGKKVDDLIEAAAIKKQYLAPTFLGNNTYIFDVYATIARQFAGNASFNTFETKGLLAKKDGTCGAWQNFALDVFAAQGISVKKESVNVIAPNSNLKVNTSIPGQGNDIPFESVWKDHALISYQDTIYDPSYGVSYGDKSAAKQAFINKLHSIGVIDSAIGTPAAAAGYNYVYYPQVLTASITTSDLKFSW